MDIGREDYPIHQRWTTVGCDGTVQTTVNCADFSIARIAKGISQMKIRRKQSRMIQLPLGGRAVRMNTLNKSDITHVWNYVMHGAVYSERHNALDEYSDVGYNFIGCIIPFILKWIAADETCCLEHVVFIIGGREQADWLTDLLNEEG